MYYSSLKRWALCAVLLIPVSVLAWGPDGHVIVGKIADHYVSDAIRPELNELLAYHQSESLAHVSNWPDYIRRERPESAPWHYVDIPITADGYDMTRFCTNGDCVVEAIHRFATELGDRRFSMSNRTEALSFLVHFAGDIHQPLHCADNDDRGGNDVEITFNGKPDNLHRFWDFDIIRATETNADTYAERIIATYGSDTNLMAECLNGTVEDWANESHAIARDFIYPNIPASHVLDGKNVEACRPVVERQLFMAGVRLARLLDASLGSDTKTPAP